MYLQTSPIRLLTREYSAYSATEKVEVPTMSSFSPSVRKNLNRLDMVNSFSNSECFGSTVAIWRVFVVSRSAATAVFDYFSCFVVLSGARLNGVT